MSERAVQLTTVGVVSAYVVVGFLTFGFGLNRKCDYTAGVGWNEGCNEADMWAAPLAPLWPIYWATRAAIEVTKP